MAIDSHSLTAPVEHPAVSRARQHRSLSTLIENLIGVLDDLGGDPDLEDGGDDEPSLSASIPTLSWEGSQDRWLQGEEDDREEVCEDEGAVTGDDEPEMGD